jgi:SAM-dependent methyltransferase
MATTPRPGEHDVSLSHLPPEVKAVRSGSFGEVASHYERYRPGPPVAAVDWLLPGTVDRVVDLGAGTGALTRLLVGRAGEVVAVEPDHRMRAVLVDEVPGARAVDGRGEALPLDDASADAVLASSSWHWMDVEPALREVARVLVPGGFLAALWTGPDPEGPFMSQARDLLTRRAGDDGNGGGEGGLTGQVLADAVRPVSTLEIPAGLPFRSPEHAKFFWEVSLDADDLIGLLGTLSWVITMTEPTRSRLFAEARRLLAELLGVEGDVTVDVAFRCDAWRSQCLA